MAIRMKDERIHAMAKQLAALTGQTQVAAIVQVLEERLAQLRTVKGKAAMDVNPMSGRENLRR